MKFGFMARARLRQITSLANGQLLLCFSWMRILKEFFCQLEWKSTWEGSLKVGSPSRQQKYFPNLLRLVRSMPVAICIFAVCLPTRLDGKSLWRIHSNPEQDLALLRVGPGAVATSSITKRNWLLDGRLKHHLIDPRRGEPADTEWLSVTVIAPQAAAAEVFAKVLLIGGSNLAVELIPEDSEISFIAVDREKSLWASARQIAESILPLS